MKRLNNNEILNRTKTFIDIRERLKVDTQNGRQVQLQLVNGNGGGNWRTLSKILAVVYILSAVTIILATKSSVLSTGDLYTNASM